MITEDQNKIFHLNYDYLWAKLSCTPYEADLQRNGPSNSSDKIELNEAKELPCYTHLYKYKDKNNIPSMSFVNKIVRFYNANLEPATTTFQFLNEILQESDTIRYRKESLVDERFTGIYYGYYYNVSLTDYNIIRGAIINIYCENRKLYANLITGICSTEQLHSQELYTLISNNHISLEEFQKYTQSLNLAEQRCYLYEGNINLTKRALTINFEGKKEEARKLMLTLNIDSFPADKTRSYKGGLGFILTTNDGPFDAQFYLMGLISTELPKLSLNDSRLPGILKIKKKKNEHIILTSTLDNNWFNLILRTNDSQN